MTFNLHFPYWARFFNFLKKYLDVSYHHVYMILNQTHVHYMLTCIMKQYKLKSFVIKLEISACQHVYRRERSICNFNLCYIGKHNNNILTNPLLTSRISRSVVKIHLWSCLKNKLFSRLNIASDRKRQNKLNLENDITEFAYIVFSKADQINILLKVLRKQYACLLS